MKKVTYVKQLKNYTCSKFKNNSNLHQLTERVVLI